MKRRNTHIDIDEFEQAMNLVERLNEVSIEDLKRELGIDGGTAYRYLEGMTDSGFIAAIGLTGRYRLCERYLRSANPTITQDPAAGESLEERGKE